MGSKSSNSRNLSTYTFCFSQRYLEETMQIKSKVSSTTLLLCNFSNIFRWQKLLSFATIQFIILYPRMQYLQSCFCGFIILQLLCNLLFKVIFPFVWNTLHSSLPNLWTIQLLWSMRVIFKEGQICDKAFKISYRRRGMYFRFFLLSLHLKTWRI